MKSTTPFAFMAILVTGTIVNALAIPPSDSINTDNVVDITGDETSLAANNASDIEFPTLEMVHKGDLISTSFAKPTLDGVFTGETEKRM
ncbi:hypothetical protein SCUP234_05147 [Seiridium cupressi]